MELSTPVRPHGPAQPGVPVLPSYPTASHSIPPHPTPSRAGTLPGPHPHSQQCQGSHADQSQEQPREDGEGQEVAEGCGQRGPPAMGLPPHGCRHSVYGTPKALGSPKRGGGVRGGWLWQPDPPWHQCQVPRLGTARWWVRAHHGGVRAPHWDSMGTPWDAHCSCFPLTMSPRQGGGAHPAPSTPASTSTTVSVY